MGRALAGRSVNIDRGCLLLSGGNLGTAANWRGGCEYPTNPDSHHRRESAEPGGGSHS